MNTAFPTIPAAPVSNVHVPGLMKPGFIKPGTAQPFKGIVFHPSERQKEEAEYAARVRMETNRKAKVGSALSGKHRFEADYYGVLLEILVRDWLLPFLDDEDYGYDSAALVQFAPLASPFAQRGPDITLLDVTYNLKSLVPSNKGFAAISCRAFLDKRQACEFYWFGRFVGLDTVHLYTPVPRCVIETDAKTWTQHRGKDGAEGFISAPIASLLPMRSVYQLPGFYAL